MSAAPVAEADPELAGEAWIFHPHSSRKLACHIPVSGRLATNLAGRIAGDRTKMAASAAREPTMEEILASIRRIIEPEGESAAPVFTSLSGGDVPAPVSVQAPAVRTAPPVAIEATQPPVLPVPPVGAIDQSIAQAPVVARAARVEGPEPAAASAAPLATARPWGVEANDARPGEPARDLRSPINAGFDRFASALQRLNRRPERAAVASVAAVSAVAMSGSNLAHAQIHARAADSAVLREETSLAVAKLRAVADSIGQRSRGEAAVAPVAHLPAPMPAAATPETAASETVTPEIVAEARLAPAAPVETAPTSASIILLQQPTVPEAVLPDWDGEGEPEIVAEFITVVPPSAANDSGEPRLEGPASFDEAELMMALSEELDRGPAAAPRAAPIAVAAPEPRVAELRRLIAEEAGGRTADAFADIASAVRTGAMGSMDEIVREILKPMLREWMDDNLPHLVERMVQDEIHRAARGSAAA